MGMLLVGAACKREATEAPAEPAAPVEVAAPVAESPPADDSASAPAEAPAADLEAAPDAAPTAAASAEVKVVDPLPKPLHGKVDDACGRDAGVGTAALPFALKTADGKPVSMASLRGKVVLLNFWGTWCKPCLKELPEFDRLVRHYRKHGVVLVAIATDTEADKVLAFARERKIGGKLVLGGEPLANQYDSPNFPFSFVIDAGGTIRGSYRSYKPECIGKIEDDLRTSLQQRKR